MKERRFIITPETIKRSIAPHDFFSKEQQQPNLNSKSSKWATAGLCPFHDDTKTGTFKINLETGAFKCWSCGARGGDIITFLQMRDGLSFPEALKKLSTEWGVN